MGILSRDGEIIGWMSGNQTQNACNARAKADCWPYVKGTSGTRRDHVMQVMGEEPVDLTW